MSDVNQKLLVALKELLIDMTLAQNNMRQAALYDAKWEGCAEAIQPRVDAARKAIEEAEKEQGSNVVTFGDDVVEYISRWGGHCRDCADNMGVCHTGMPCGSETKAIKHVLSALAYGINNGFLLDFTPKQKGIRE